MTSTSCQLERAMSRASAIGISAATLSTLVGVKPATLSNAVRGVRKLDNEVEYKLATLTLLLAEIAEALKPQLLPNDPKSLGVLVAFVQEHGITSDQVRTAVVSVFGLDIIE